MGHTENSDNEQQIPWSNGVKWFAHPSLLPLSSIDTAPHHIKNHLDAVESVPVELSGFATCTEYSLLRYIIPL